MFLYLAHAVILADTAHPIDPHSLPVWLRSLLKFLLLGGAVIWVVATLTNRRHHKDHDIHPFEKDRRDR